MQELKLKNKFQRIELWSYEARSMVSSSSTNSEKKNLTFPIPISDKTISIQFSQNKKKKISY